MVGARDSRGARAEDGVFGHSGAVEPVRGGRPEICWPELPSSTVGETLVDVEAAVEVVFGDDGAPPQFCRAGVV
jgi:hypothetical protein